MALSQNNPTLLVSLFLVSLLCLPSTALQFQQQYIDYNLNQNQTAVEVENYYGIWENHSFYPSPSNWRVPFYTLFLDKFVNGDPSNDDINGTAFEHDLMQTQLRHGGDLQGLVDSLDYIQGMGIEAIYIAGTPFINQPWGADAYSPLDFSLLDQHFGSIQAWRDAITAIHDRGMYIMIDNTMSTMGDLLAFEGYLNASVPFTPKEHEVLYRDSSRQYADFTFGNNYNTSCEYPRFWLENGFPVGTDVTSQLTGCYDSEFDQYGDFEGLGDFDGWKRSLSKAAGVQDRLRDWIPSVREKIEIFSCLTIMMLDIDGYRIDKATQVTVDALGEFSHAMRECARAVGKENFFITGEISGGNTFGSIFLGRGRQPDMQVSSQLEAVTLTNMSNSSLFIRGNDQNGLDSAAFHYSIYRSLTRLLGMDGLIEGPYDTPVGLVDAWNDLLLTNDLVNPNTGVFDPRHMFGTTNQDNFRWPAVANGTAKMLLGQFLTTLHMPGIPLLLWGEEQAFYVLDSTSDDYIFGRQSMSSSQAWKMHGCYRVGSSQYHNFLEDGAPALDGCYDDWNTLDHRDPTHPIRNIIKSMYQMRKNYPVLNDGWRLQELSKQTRSTFLPASDGTATEIGMWSAMRGNFEEVQDLSASGQGNQSVWLVYQNDNQVVDYSFDCSNASLALVSPFDANTTVKNLFYPYDEIVLEASPVQLGINGSLGFNGCLSNLTLSPFEYRAYVPIDTFIGPGPMITKFLPGHDSRLEITDPQNNTIPIELHFSAAMDCTEVFTSISIISTTEDGTTAVLDPNSVTCFSIDPEPVAPWFGSLPSVWTFNASLINVSEGIHVITIKDVPTEDGLASTQSTDKLFLRVGRSDNPVVFPGSANYTQDLLHRDENGDLLISHKAAGADQFRYSLNWGSSYSPWQTYTGGNSTLAPRQWSGTKAQDWKGEHVIVQYHSSILGSSDHVQHGDLDANTPSRRFPHLFLHGDFNRYGLDSGMDNSMKLSTNGTWAYNMLAEWPATLQVNEWGINPDGQQDQTGVYGDLDKDGVLDRLPPSSLIPATLGLNATPPSPFLNWHLELNDGTLEYEFKPTGNRWHQLIMFILMWVIPVLTGSLAVWAYLQSFYQVKFNKIGIPMQKYSPIPMLSRAFKRKNNLGYKESPFGSSASLLRYNGPSSSAGPIPPQHMRRTVLIATMEYDIEDWAIKIKIGGLGVMAQLMGKNLEHQDLIWVVPCVGGVDYPIDEPTTPMDITIMGKSYQIQVQLHVFRNITYVLLDAPIFRAQTKTDPYPARMDDIDSAIYYSAWNQCIAETIRRFNPDLYHINDYHGALAPVHLLPETIPCVLSLHNAEFQGLWAMKNDEEAKEVCEVYNIPTEVAQKYVQFGDVFNLLHAGASYLRIHQKGFGAVGVSKKYGKRSWARYPIFWGLNKIGQLPNPDPSDLAEWTPAQIEGDVEIDEEFEKNRADLRVQAQQWAGLTVDPLAELLVFVGRWSMQKGVDLIADVMPGLLEENEKIQLICIGPVIDLYGKFAALKLDVLMKKYPGRVYSKPEFTALPPYIFSGAEFALIPSRDEPFGLVAVEFGRKGALGIGARVGGLGQMPGWWFTVESTTTSHMLSQFKKAIKGALASDIETRKKMRARSAKQRFPVAQWVADLEELQNTAIRIHRKETACPKCDRPGNRGRTGSPYSRRITSAPCSRSCSPNGRVSSPAPTHHRGRRSEVQQPFIRDASSNGRDLTSRSRSGSSATLNRKAISRTRSPLGNVVINAEDDGAMVSSMSTPPNMPELTRSMAAAGVWNAAGHRRQTSSQSYLTPTPGLMTPSSSNYDVLTNDGDSMPGTPPMEDDDDFLPPNHNFYQNENLSTLSLETVIGTKQDFSLQKVDPSFTDSTEEYFNDFKVKLRKLEASNSESALCIEDYLVKSEKAWFGRFRDAKLGKTPRSSPAPSIFNTSKPSTPQLGASNPLISDPLDEFKLSESYRPPRGVKKYLQYKIGDWPIYTFFLALGQIMAANSYQITLLTRSQGQNAEEFYIIAGIYLIASLSWWICYRSLKSVYVLSLPFLLYSIAFLLLGCVPFYPSNAMFSIARVQNAATGFYTVASASGSLYFALNFGDEGGSPVKSWVNRACIIQGTQQIYICALWFWGAHLNSASYSTDPLSKTMAYILIPLSVVLSSIAFLLLYGLPSYYHQSPGKIPSLFPSLFRRKIVLWFFITVIIQNFFLSSLTGRNWSYLWSSKHVPSYAIALLALFFFILVWASFLYFFGLAAKTHTWILPIFAIGLGAPRWAQILWSCTSIGLYLPWAGSPLASALLGRALWLWLGVLDALQGVGFGMILLQTLTRVHISATLIGAQVLGVSVTALAHAVGPQRGGVGSVFPDFGRESVSACLGSGWFWMGLGCQMVVCVGFFKFFRKEQLSKP
ncbi:alpha-1,3-glucan synthase Ags2 [Mollisia scopiformis]|uniref:alpha-1,3-glucan synthase n=1 Tax=Mollisia scopiformis TaxID=149040 RepID=A0A194WXV3_MOLSC|nr:alpha-1,3-glucan synthase Ags2 [Mollisia scopiformis]KUJ12806.1 alpha-1,3-glucan synthase Ags2 [Mollisia scopiformis]